MLKSAYELAMERTGGETAGITAEQRKLLSELDAKFRAQIAEKEILYASRIQDALLGGDAAVVEELKAELADERARLEETRNREKNRVRGVPDSP